MLLVLKESTALLTSVATDLLLELNPCKLVLKELTLLLRYKLNVNPAHQVTHALTLLMLLYLVLLVHTNLEATKHVWTYPSGLRVTLAKQLLLVLVNSTLL